MSHEQHLYMDETSDREARKADRKAKFNRKGNRPEKKGDRDAQKREMREQRYR